MTTEEILSYYRINSNLVDGVLFKPNEIKKLIIGFTGMNAGKFERWSWFHEWFRIAPDTAYLVLRDEDHLFYLNRDGSNSRDYHVNYISDLIKDNDIDSNNIITVGSSMGGYAALYYGSLFNANMTIASVPLVDIHSASLNTFTLWTRKMKELEDNWINLDDFLRKQSHLPFLYLITGKFVADVSAANKLKNIYTERKGLFKHVQTDDDRHGDYLSKETLFNLLNNKALNDY